jgi:drug/metabolite transporter (DMT)-like permease
VQFGRATLLFGAMCLVWGTTWVAVKAGIAVVPPSLFAGTRFITAGLLLAALVRLRGGSLRLVPADAPRLVLVALLMITATYALLFWGAQFVNSGLAAILDLAFMPVALLAIGAALGEDRLTLVRALGVAIGVVGLIVLFGPKALALHRAAGPSGSRELLGGGAIVASALVYSLGSVLSRPLLRAYSPLFVSAATTLAGGAVLLAGSLAFEPGAAGALAGHWGPAAWAAWLFLVFGGSLVAYTIYLRLIGEWGASRAGSYAFVSPIIAVLLGMLVFGETVTASAVVGMVAMLGGAWLTLRPAPAAPA